MSKAKTTEVAALPPANSSAVVAMDPLLAMIERATRDPAIDLDRLERLMAMKERADKVDAEGAFNDAMAKVQMELTPIARDSHNPQTRSKYASYFAVDKAIRPVYTKYGIAVSFDEAQEFFQDFVRVMAFVSKGRFTKTFHYDSPVVTTGIQGKAMMTLTHARASAVTYAKRYLMGMIFNLSTGEDSDGNVQLVEQKEISAQQLEELATLLSHDEQKIAAICAYYEVASLSDMTEATFLRAMKSIEAKKKMAEREAKQ